MDPIITPIVIAVIIALVPSVIMALMHRKWQKTDNKATADDLNDEEILNIKKRVWRLEKNAVITSKIIDDQTEKQHPELSSNLEDITNELLRDTDKG